MQSFEIQNNATISFLASGIQIAKRQYNSEQEVGFTFVNLLSNIKDVKVNNHSSLILTERQNINQIFEKEELNNTSTDTINTTLGFNYDISPVYLAVDHANFNTNNTSSVYLTSATSNNTFFDIKLLNDFTCKLSHLFDNNTRYLTIVGVDLKFVNDLDTDYLGSESTQVFHYIYDKINGIFVLFKRIAGVSVYVSLVNNSLVIQNVGNNTNITQNSLIKVQKFSLDGKLPETFNAHYVPDLKNNTITISDELSREDIQKSYIVHTEVDRNSNNTLDLNLFSVKNSQTPESYSAEYDDILDSDKFSYRNYNKIFSGSKQELGDYNLSLGYDGYSTQLRFKPDKLTFFHIPYNSYPYVKININDTNLAYCGAIAGSSPLQSDKLIKKRADYKYSSSFGQPTDETNGEYLCTWLSANHIKPLWVDRYYNPQNISKNTALSVLDVITFNDTFSLIKNSQVIFDKISDVTLEGGSLYAYHHLGKKDYQLYIQSLSGDLINSQDATIFTGNNYLNIADISDIYQTNQFTVTFDLYNKDWTQPFANQIVGNYIQDGFGLFNKNLISPLVYCFEGNRLFVYSSDLTLLHTSVFENNIRGLIRRENLKDYFIIFDNNQVTQISTDQTEKYKIDSNIIDFTTIKSTYTLQNSGGFIASDRDISKIISFDYSLRTLVDITTASNIVMLSSVSVDQASTINYYNGSFYCTDKKNSHRYNTDIYYIDTDKINRWDISTNTVYPFLSASTSVQHFNIDKDGYLWVLYGDKLTKLDTNKNIILSQVLNLSAYNHLNVDFITELVAGIFQYNVLITSQHNIDNSVILTKMDIGGNVITQATNTDIENKLYNINSTNSSYIRQEMPELFTDSNINSIVSLQDKTDLSKFLYLNSNSISLSSIDAGYHNFCIKLDCTRGIFDTFIDGINVSNIRFEPNKYLLSNNLQKNMYIGTIPFYNGTVLSNYTNQSSKFLMGNVSLQNFAIYRIALPDSVILLNSNINKSFQDIVFNVYTGKRSFIDEIDSFFKMTTPGFMSNYYNLNIKNTGITNRDVQLVFEKRLLQKLTEITPGYAIPKDINWI